jgi:hypothetical protein
MRELVYVASRRQLRQSPVNLFTDMLPFPLALHTKVLRASFLKLFFLSFSFFLLLLLLLLFFFFLLASTFFGVLHLNDHRCTLSTGHPIECL